MEEAATAVTEQRRWNVGDRVRWPHQSTSTRDNGERRYPNAKLRERFGVVEGYNDDGTVRVRSGAVLTFVESDRLLPDPILRDAASRLSAVLQRHGYTRKPRASGSGGGGVWENPK